MAYCALVSLTNTLELIVHSHHSHSFHVREHVLSLHQKIQVLEALFQEKSSEEENMDSLGTRIRDAAYRIEDIIEKLTTEQIEGADSSDQDYEELEEAIVEIDSIIEELSRDKCGQKDSTPRKYLRVGGPSRPLRGGKSSVMVGVDEDVIELKDRLVGRESKLQSIPVVGMGGIGKTTLARNLFDDALVKYRFDLRAWATISQTYVVRDVLQGLLKDMGVANTNEQEEMSIQVLIEKLYKKLKGRRYLIVLDDMWNTEVWDDLRRIFPDDANGSRIMLTSRLVDVVTYATDSSSPPHEIRLLDEEKSWDLFCQEVFAQQGCPSEFKELEEIGQMIARNCKGLPLSINVIGGVLAKSSMTQKFWEYVARNVNSIAIESDEHCYEILSLSYNNLPRHLQPCFLYFGIFPEDRAISVTQLIRLWIVEGFLKPNKSKDFEETAEEYLQDLIERNLVFVRKKRSDGRSRTCGIHDLLRDLCIKEAQKENFLHIVDSEIPFLPSGMNFPRRLSMRLNIAEDNFVADVIRNTMESVKLVRTLVCNNCSPLPYSKCFTLLRVLDIMHADIKGRFPDAILLLENLRYLAMNLSSLQSIPSRISLFRNLQVLITSSRLYRKYGALFAMLRAGIKKPKALVDRPTEMASEILQMEHLRHLKVRDCSLPNPIDRENNLVVLKDLQTLSMVSGFRCTEEVLKKFPNLRKLVVYYHSIHDFSGYNLENFVHFPKLENLRFAFGMIGGHTFLHNIIFPQSLKKLKLEHCKLPWKEMTIIGSLPNLEVLKLINDAFDGPVWESVEGEFCQLKFLEIYGLNLKQWQAENTHFPCLEKLVINCCDELKEIPSDIGEIDTLEMIEIDNASDSALASVEQILEEQQSMGNYVLQVHVQRWKSDRAGITTARS